MAEHFDRQKINVMTLISHSLKFIYVRSMMMVVQKSVATEKLVLVLIKNEIWRLNTYSELKSW